MEDNFSGALQVAAAVVERAKESGFLNEGESLNVIAELSGTEKDFFIGLIRDLDRHLAAKEQPELSHGELSSIFSFVYARGCEAASCYLAGQQWEPDKMGMFDGKIPFYADERFTGELKKCELPAVCGGAFADFDCAGAGVDAKLALLEALKWTWRLSVHFMCALREDASERP